MKEYQKKKIKELVQSLEKDMKEINKMKQGFSSEKSNFSSPQKTQKVLEEIVVPPLEILSEKPVKKKKS